MITVEIEIADAVKISLRLLNRIFGFGDPNMCLHFRSRYRVETSHIAYSSSIADMFRTLFPSHPSL